jgi:hypothetical protein
VRPVFEPFQMGSGILAQDASGAVGNPWESMSCQGWSRSWLGGPAGLSLDASGRFSQKDCEVPVAVSCCASVP